MEENKNQKAFLIDATKCIGCRGCQVSCKQWNNLPAEKTEFFGGPGYQNPKNLSDSTYTLIKYHEVVENDKLIDWVYSKNQCQHCLEPACISACLVGAMHKTDDGAIVYDVTKCIGCRYCMLGCPFDVPKFEWYDINPEIRKCNFCIDRIEEGLEPACLKTCPTGAIKYGDRDDLIKEAEERLSENPDKYHQHIYGKDEVGGTSILNISSIPLEKLGYPKNLTTESLGNKTAITMNAIPPIVIGLGVVLGITAFIANRKNKIVQQQEKEKEDNNE